MASQFANPTVLVNNKPVGILPNTLVFREGLGEQNYRNASYGGDEIEPVYSDNVDSKNGMVSFSLPVTINNIALARAWKLNRDQNVIQIVGKTTDGEITKTFTRAALLTDYDVAPGAETDIAIEFKSRPAS